MPEHVLMAVFAQDVVTHLAFIAFVAVAVYVQNLTGFALALVLLGLVGLTSLVPLTDAVNAVMMISIVNAAVFLYRRRPLSIETEFRPAIVSSLIGTVAGIVILAFVATHALHTLRLLLGVCIIACALLLWRTTTPYPAVSGVRYFTIAGSLSGILGGMFSTAGPPLVYAVYRQPWSVKTIQESLVFCFGVGSVVRLIVMAFSGQISTQAMVLAAGSIPVVFAVTLFAANRPLPFSKDVLRRAVCVLLIGAGAGMLI